MRRCFGLAVLTAGLFALAAVSSAAEVPGFQLLGKLSPNHSSWPLGVSGDGSAVSGLSGTGTHYDAFRWTSAGGMQSIGAPPGFTDGSADQVFVSDDGSSVVSSFYFPENPMLPGRSFRWTSGGGFVPLGTLAGHPDDYVAARAISGDGSVIVGEGSNANGAFEAFRWTAATGMTGLGFLDPSNPSSIAYDVTPDGSAVVGGSTGADGTGHQVRWTQQGGPQALSELPSAKGSAAVAVSDDGRVVVGTVGLDNPQGNGYRWTESGGMQLLRPASAGTTEVVRDVSGDGRIVVGNAEYGAFISDEAHGMRSLRDVLVNDYGLGPQLDGWSLGSAEAISSDGHTIVGGALGPNSQLQVYRAIIPEPSATALFALAAGLFLRRRRRAAGSRPLAPSKALLCRFRRARELRMQP